MLTSIGPSDLRTVPLFHNLTDPHLEELMRAFQRQEGLPVTGRADPRTRRALGPLGRPLFGTRTLRKGAFGWDVAVLQFMLVRQGLGAPVNGYFDHPTLTALKAYQRAFQRHPRRSQRQKRS